MTTLKYCPGGTVDVVSLDKYILDDGKIINKKSGKVLSYSQNSRGDYMCGVYFNDGKGTPIYVARAILATLVGPPPTIHHTADHIDGKPENNSIENLHWASKSEQSVNRTMPKTFNSAYIIVKDGIERTTNEWAKIEAVEPCTIRRYAQDNKHGFSYKEYPNLPEEIWKTIEGSESSKGRWEVSNKLRAKYIMKHASIVYDDFVSTSGYPSIKVNGQQKYIHRLVFEAFNPDVDKCEVVRHLDDNPKNFAPENLVAGTHSDNREDAYNNGSYDGTKSARRAVTSYINGMKERDFKSLVEAVEHLKENGHPKASKGNVHFGMITGKIRYGRTWKC